MIWPIRVLPVRGRAWRRGWLPGALVLGIGGAFPDAVCAQPIVAAFERFHAADNSAQSQVEGGLLLLNELNCVACHAPPAGWRDRLGGRGRISLADVGRRLSAQTLAAFVSDPQAVKPGTVMPHAAPSAPAELDALAAFLSSLVSNEPRPETPAENASRGRALFENVGCVSCHAPGDAKTNYPSVPLGLASHYDRDALAAFLRDPLRTRPAGRMPAAELSESEAADLAAFLRADRVEPARVDSARSAMGRKIFERSGCAACHDAGTPMQIPRAPALNEVHEGRGCLAEKRSGTAPGFKLSATQVRAVTAALAAMKASPAPEPPAATAALESRFKQLNCYACHAWRGKGGVESDRAKYFAAANGAAESLGELGHLPPKLDQAGRKLTAAWMEKLFWGSGGGVRPYLSVRMPRYGRENGALLIPLLEAACRPDKPAVIDTSGAKGHQRSATGRALIGTGEGGLGCVSCHGLRDREPSGVHAINLTHTAQRVRPEYFKALLLDPQGMQPGTIMPPLFASRKNANLEVESLWTYLKEFDQNPRLPDGLEIRDAFELKPEGGGRPIVFRTFLVGAGTHAIAVGFPAKVHVAFDAHEVRWALVWRGRFLDAMSNWEERAMPPVKPLGEGSRMLPRHMPFAPLSAPDQVWPANFGRAAGYEFKGYRLDPKGVPTFRYRVGALEVEDVITPSADGASLRRTLSVHRTNGDHGTWYFRGLSGNVPVPLEWKDDVAVVEEIIPL